MLTSVAASTLFVRTKIQFFESKSQHQSPLWYQSFCCSSEQRYNFLKANHNSWRCYTLWWYVVRQNKDTIFWKQITTNGIHIFNRFELFVRTKIQFFESKSQRPCFLSVQWFRCSSEQRYNFLKANHNASLRYALR